MKSTKLNDTYLVRCDIGDEIVSSLKKFALDNKIFSGIVLGIGSIKDPELGYYDIHKKEYIKRQFKGDFELLSLIGNFARFEDQAALHCHVSLSGPQFDAIGGHLFRADVAVTTEFFIRPGGLELHRALDNATGLNLLKV